MSVAALNLSAKPGGMDEQLVQLPPDTGAALLALTTVPKLGASVPAPQAMSSVPLTQDVHGEQAGLHPFSVLHPLVTLDPLPRSTPYRASPLYQVVFASTPYHATPPNHAATPLPRYTFTPGRLQVGLRRRRCRAH